MAKKVLFIQHGEDDVPALLADTLVYEGVALTICRPYLREPVPEDIGDFDGLAVGGGAMSVYQTEEYPYLTEVIALIQKTEKAGKPILGLCLGAQLMAAAFAAEVRRNERREIGFHTVTKTEEAGSDSLFELLPDLFWPTHWHGDVFELPPGAVRLAWSDLTPNQAFRFGDKAYGLQFHLEMTPKVLEAMIPGSEEYLAAAGVDPVALVETGRKLLPHLEPSARAFFVQWAHLL